MKAIGHTIACPITADNALIELNIDKPQSGPRDLLVRVRAISVNPVDVKVRELMDPDGPHRILGYDAAGIVEAVGADVTLFHPGDEILYAGEFMRLDGNAEFQLVDDPQNLDIASIKHKALTLTWELMLARSMFQKEDMNVQHKILNSV